ncbi:MAG TPA: phosphate signaling complex protein PhoU [Anaerolineaceae bacterium]|nr:phosphate signaling complex protein PhoU [Anaerolineaceae bacterium]
MVRKTFDQFMSQLKREILILGSMVENSTFGAVNALTGGDFTAARAIYRNDHCINEKRYAIENAVLGQIATQQPMAHDLRVLTAILYVANELERMGDYAKGISKIALNISNEDIRIPVNEFQEMARLSIGMLHNCLSAFIEENPVMAQQIPKEDDLVDAYYNRIYRIVVLGMLADPDTIDQANYLLWVAHNLERLADRVVNICERTLFICTGELLEMDNDEDSVVSITK